MDQKTVVIRKYENRRLYDTANSRYINLDEVADLVRRGADVQVVDAASGEDLTRLVLTQIIVEEAKAPGSAFPLDMLRQMVVASGRMSQETLLKYMRAVFDMYQNAYRTFAPPMNFLDLINPAAPSRPPVPERHPEPSAENQVTELRRRIEELEGQVKHSAVRGTRKRRKPKKAPLR